jgi:hypothetical protein
MQNRSGMNGEPPAQGTEPGGMQIKTYTGLLSVKGTDRNIYLAIDGRSYKVVLPEPPDGKQGRGPGGQGGSPDSQMPGGMERTELPNSYCSAAKKHNNSLSVLILLLCCSAGIFYRQNGKRWNEERKYTCSDNNQLRVPR